jgi:hypothetical protein
MDPSTATLLLGIIGIVRTLADGGELTADQRATLRSTELELEAKVVADINKDLGQT